MAPVMTSVCLAAIISSDGRTTNKPIVFTYCPDCRADRGHRHHRIHRSHGEVKSSIHLFLSLIFGTTLAHGAVIMVRGQSVQEAINNASTEPLGFLKFYSENITITVKSLSLVVQPGESVQINNITANNPNECDPFKNLLQVMSMELYMILTFMVAT